MRPAQFVTQRVTNWEGPVELAHECGLEASKPLPKSRVKASASRSRSRSP